MAHMYRIMRNSPKLGTECVSDRLVSKELAEQVIQVLNRTKNPTDSYFIQGYEECRHAKG